MKKNKTRAELEHDYEIALMFVENEHGKDSDEYRQAEANAKLCLEDDLQYGTGLFYRGDKK